MPEAAGQRADATDWFCGRHRRRFTAAWVYRVVVIAAGFLRTPEQISSRSVRSTRAAGRWDVGKVVQKEYALEERQFQTRLFVCCALRPLAAKACCSFYTRRGTGPWDVLCAAGWETGERA